MEQSSARNAEQVFRRGRRKIKIESSILIQTRIPGITVTRAEDIKRNSKTDISTAARAEISSIIKYKEEKFEKEDVQRNKVMGVLSYIGILVLVPLLAGNKSSPYLRHHLNQGIVLWITSLILNLITNGSLPGLSDILSLFMGTFSCGRRAFSGPFLSLRLQGS